MREIPLTQGMVALIDDEDYDRVSAFRWYAGFDHDSQQWYALRGDYTSGTRVTVRMHRFVLNAGSGVLVDHIDRNGLNNQRSNLRACTKAQNNRNAVTKNRTGFKGVTRRPEGRFEARLGSRTGRRLIGVFSDATSAALAYDEAARLRYGEFARLNFPRDGEQGALVDLRLPPPTRENRRAAREAVVA